MTEDGDQKKPEGLLLDEGRREQMKLELDKLKRLIFYSFVGHAAEELDSLPRHPQGTSANSRPRDPVSITVTSTFLKVPPMK